MNKHQFTDNRSVEIKYMNLIGCFTQRLGNIEKIDLDDASVDVVISNCVLNLVPEKKKAFL